MLWEECCGQISPLRSCYKYLGLWMYLLHVQSHGGLGELLPSTVDSILQGALFWRLISYDPRLATAAY